MKKITSIAIALMMVLGATAQIHQAAQVTQEDDIVSATACYMKGHTAGSYTYGDQDFNIVFSDKDGNSVAYVEITAPSASNLQGTYHLGDGYTMFVAGVYDESTFYPMTHGDLMMVCKGVQTIPVPDYGDVTFYTYEVQALNWYNNKTGANVMEFHGTVVLHAENYTTKAVMTLNDKAVNATEISLISDDFGTSQAGDYWEYVGFDQVGKNGMDMVCFSDSVLTDAQGNGYYLTQGVYDIYNMADVAEVYVNGNNVFKTMTDIMGYVVEKKPGSNEKFVISFYVEYNKAWYHMTGLYDSTASGIEEVKAAEVNGTAKMMDKNGQLMIIRNGVRYNAQGAVISR